MRRIPVVDAFCHFYFQRRSEHSIEEKNLYFEVTCSNSSFSNSSFLVAPYISIHSAIQIVNNTRRLARVNEDFIRNDVRHVPSVEGMRELSFDVSRGVTEIYPDFAVAWGDFCDVSLQTSDTCTRFSVLNGTFFSLFQLLHKSRSIQGRTKRNGVFFSDFMWTCSHPPRICVYAYMHGRGNRSLISISFRKRVR